MYVEIHTLTPMPWNNVNRDESGSPKHGDFHGRAHGYISSQSKKRAMKRHLAASGDDTLLTQRAVALVAKALEADGVDPAEAMEAAKDLLSTAGLFDKGKARKAAEKRTASKKAAEKKAAEKKAGDSAEADDDAEEEADGNGLGAAYLLTRGQAAAVAALAGTDPKKQQIVDALNDGISFTQALFGRFFANRDDLSIEAGMQVAHALYLNTYRQTLDYYTALDDLKEEQGQSGAAMVGVKEFTSGPLYQHAVIDVEQLRRNLPGQDPAPVVRAAVAAFAHAMPSGTKNGTAPGAVPEHILVTVHNGCPVNLATAFTLDRRHTWTVDDAVGTLMSRWRDTQKMQVAVPLATLTLSLAGQEHPGAVDDLPALLDAVEATIAKEVRE